MTVRKNLAYNFFTREFLQWVLHDSKEGKALLDWSMDTYSPDEHYWLMLHTYPGAPGGSNLMSGFQLARMILWSFTNQLYACYGKCRRTNGGPKQSGKSGQKSSAYRANANNKSSLLYQHMQNVYQIYSCISFICLQLQFYLCKILPKLWAGRRHIEPQRKRHIELNAFKNDGGSCTVMANCCDMNHAIKTEFRLKSTSD